jgi:hypothetical protein
VRLRRFRKCDAARHAFKTMQVRVLAQPRMYERHGDAAERTEWLVRIAIDDVHGVLWGITGCDALMQISIGAKKPAFWTATTVPHRQDYVMFRTRQSADRP